MQGSTVGAVAILTPVAVGLIAWLIARGRPAALSVEGGTIGPEKWSAAITVAFGSLVFVGGALAASVAQWGYAASFLLFGGAMAGFMAPSLTNQHRVIWNADGVEGPSRMFGLTLGLARTHVAWSEIVRTGKTWTGYWFIETADRRRIYWSYLYKGYPAFVGGLHRRRPDVALPEDFTR